MGTKINEMTMTEIVNRAVELGFPMRKRRAKCISTGTARAN